MDFTRQPVELIPADYEHVAMIFRRAANRHMHLDWRTIEQWLKEPNCRMRAIRVNGAVQALVGATLHTHPHDEVAGSPAAWLRFILPTQNINDPALDAMWEALRDDLHAQGVQQIAALIIQPWSERVFERWGFEEVNAIVTLRRLQGHIPNGPQPPAHLRAGTAADIDAVAAVDATAFGALWAYSPATIRLAQSEATSFHVIEREGRIVAYEISTDHYSSGHLARLAVLPECQGMGYGKALTGAMLRHFNAQRIKLITVNTQADNHRSRKLYERLGFEPSGHHVPLVLHTI